MKLSLLKADLHTLDVLNKHTYADGKAGKNACRQADLESKEQGITWIGFICEIDMKLQADKFHYVCST